jgi:hypothetical protein
MPHALDQHRCVGLKFSRLGYCLSLRRRNGARPFRVCSTNGKVALWPALDKQVFIAHLSFPFSSVQSKLSSPRRRSSPQRLGHVVLAPAGKSLQSERLRAAEQSAQSSSPWPKRFHGWSPRVFWFPDPGQPSPGFCVPTRRAQGLRTRTDVDAFRKGRILPSELLPILFAEKVAPLFRRGDHDIAVFQAFKEIEVAVRNTANAKGAGYSDSEVGTPLMRKAFHPDTGPLSDKALVPEEREAEMHLFAAAIGHAKNPTSHRDVAMTALEAARLFVFASHLFDIVERRAK